MFGIIMSKINRQFRCQIAVPYTHGNYITTRSFYMSLKITYNFIFTIIISKCYKIYFLLLSLIFGHACSLPWYNLFETDIFF